MSQEPVAMGSAPSQQPGSSDSKWTKLVKATSNDVPKDDPGARIPYTECTLMKSGTARKPGAMVGEGASPGRRLLAHKSPPFLYLRVASQDPLVVVSEIFGTQVICGEIRNERAQRPATDG